MIQYDFFQAHDPFFEFREEQEIQKDALRRTQKRFFAQNNELMKLIIKQQKEIEELSKRIERLLTIKNS